MKLMSFKTLCGGVFFAVSIMAAPQVHAMDGVAHPFSYVDQSNPVISTRAELRGYKYKILNGKQWKRLWSYTRARWIDSKWTLA